MITPKQVLEKQNHWLKKNNFYIKYNSLPLSYFIDTFSNFTLKPKNKNLKSTKIFLFAKMSIRKLLSKKPKKHNNIIFISQSENWRNSKDIMIDSVTKHFNPLTIEFDTTRGIPFKTLKEKSSANRTFAEAYLTKIAIKKIKTKAKQLAKIPLSSHKHLLYIDFIKAIETIEITKEIILRKKPKAFVLTYETGLHGRAVIATAKKLGVPTIAIQHGIPNPYDYLSTTKETRADKTCVFGPRYKKLLISYGYPSSSIVVTGQPRFDELFNMKTKRNNKKIITIATQPLPEMKQIVEETQKAGKQLNTKVIIKPHPGDKNKYKGNVIRNIEIPKLLNMTNALVTKHSTLALEAAIADRQVVLVNFTKEPDPVPYVKQGLALGVYKPEDLKPALEKALATKPKINQKVLYNEAYKLDGKASERVAEVIRKVMKNA